MSFVVSEIDKKVHAGERISTEEAAFLWRNASDDELQSMAKAVRARFHEPDVATYLLMRIVNYTNVCVAKCDYCSFYRLPNSPEGYVRDKNWVFEKIDELVDVGGDLFGFNGGFNPKLRMEYYTDLFGSIRQRYGDSIEFYALTVVELLYVARLCKLPVPEALKMLKEAGVRWITGGGAEILADSFRKRHSPLKYTVKEYLDTQRHILEAGMNTTATMVIGFDETLEERLEHLSSIREFQDEVTGGSPAISQGSTATSQDSPAIQQGLPATRTGLFSFLCWTYKPYNNELGGVEVSKEEYLRWIALSRIYLDNVKNIRASVLTQNANGLKALSYGANDFDIPWEDEVTQLAGAVIEKDVAKVLGYAHEEGFKTVYRHVAKTPNAVATH